MKVSGIGPTTPPAAGSGAPAPVAAQPGDTVELGRRDEAPVVDLGAAARALASVKAEGDVVSVWRLPVGHWDPTAFVSPSGQLFEAGLGPDFQALSPEGRPLWSAFAGRNELSVNPALTPRGDLVVSRVEGLECYGPDGKRRWSKPLSDSLSLHCSAGPEGNVYVHDRRRLYALGPEGEVLWKKRFRAAWGDDPPVVGPDGTVHVVTKDSVVVAYSPDGKERWRYEGLRSQGILADVTTRLAVGPEGSVYLGDRWGSLRALGPDGGERWVRKVGSELTHYESPVVDGHGNVYLGADRHGEEVVAFAPDGTELWRRRVGPVLNLTGDPSGGVVVGVKGGPLHSFDERGLRRWTFQEDTVFTRPAFGPDGTLYAGAGLNLYALVPHREMVERRTEAALRQAREAPGEAPERIDEGPGWVLIGDVKLPVHGASAP